MEKITPSEIERLSEKIKQISAAIKSDSNPEELVEYSKLIKKNVSFFDRGYFAAYLLREMEKKAPVEKTFKKREFDGKKKERPARSEFKKNDTPAAEKAPRKERSERPQEETREKRAPRVIPEGAKTLYVNLGKLGRIYGRDLIDIICNASGVSRDDIYSVRVHDKYSFVTMSEENCNKAIAALQGTEVKGRTVQINISNRDNSQRRQKAEAKVEEAPVAEETSTPAVQSSPVVEETPKMVEEVAPSIEETPAPAVEEVKEEAAPAAEPETAEKAEKPAESESVITFSVREI